MANNNRFVLYILVLWWELIVGKTKCGVFASYYYITIADLNWHWAFEQKTIPYGAEKDKNMEMGLYLTQKSAGR